MKSSYSTASDADGAAAATVPDATAKPTFVVTLADENGTTMVTFHFAPGDLLLGCAGGSDNAARVFTALRAVPADLFKVTATYHLIDDEIVDLN